ncbi:acyl carrier protein [Streptomyces tateyamensis]|nr:acyl carrier protein [Streptomyces tateyamensis]
MISTSQEPISRERLVEILAEITTVSAADIDDTVTFESLELDSLALAELLVAVENETGGHIGFGLDFTPATTIVEAHRTLNSALTAAQASAG